MSENVQTTVDEGKSNGAAVSPPPPGNEQATGKAERQERVSPPLLERSSEVIVQLILICAVGVVVLLNYFEVQKIRVSVVDSVREHTVAIRNLNSEVRAAKQDLTRAISDFREFEKKLSSGFSKIIE